MTQECYQAAITAFDKANADDPKREIADGKEHPEGRWGYLQMSPRAREFSLTGRARLPEALMPLILKAVQ